MTTPSTGNDRTLDDRFAYDRIMVDDRSRSVDVLIVGAGISGLSAAWHLRRYHPSLTVSIVERRHRIGGTWDLFRYPGIRSDSDMETFGFSFRPWQGTDSIAQGADIQAYLERTAAEFELDDLIEFGRSVTAAEFVSDEARWLIDVECEDGTSERWSASWLWMCSGYYRYDRGHSPDIEGLDAFAGTVIHPQHWPDGFDPTGRRIVVIGSGATAFTLVPALAERASRVTMLQRSPTFVASVPRVNRINSWLRRFLPSRFGAAVARWRNALTSSWWFRLTRRHPERVRRLLLGRVQRELPAGVGVEPHFSPRYDPWDQRICAVPDGDFFAAMRAGTVEVVTDRVSLLTRDGVALASGRTLDCDTIVTATGLEIQMFGGAELRVDGRAVDPGSTVMYRGCMLSGVPNFTWTMGYVNASWTLKADLVARYVCRVLTERAHVGADVAVAPVPAGGIAVEVDSAFSPGYLVRAKRIMPQRGLEQPWRLAEDYLLDRLMLTRGTLRDGVLRFEQRSREFQRAVRS
ncbi:MAG: putative flavoprotein involved in transport [Actinomycetota bacterium]|jgi:cation diffusion facilitator CzcD-associated flavoprotein CzcO